MNTKHNYKPFIFNFRLLLILFSFLICSSSYSQINNADLKTTKNGIVYFSYDNGMHWVNASNGLPEKTNIGLGGIATSNQLLGLATKENGIYIYNFTNNIWENIPTDNQIINANIGSMAFFDSTIFVGTQFKGVFFSTNMGKSWQNLNNGLSNFTIRRFCVIDKNLYVCTNDGFYSLNNIMNLWKLEFGQILLQTNGATFYNGCFYLATNKGIFKQQNDKSWTNSSPELSMHNISSDQNQLFAMTYNKLLISSTDGRNWKSEQMGLPDNLYTFNVINHKNILFAGQWNGIYRKNNFDIYWQLTNNGLPSNFAVTNLNVFNQMLIISTTEAK